MSKVPTTLPARQCMPHANTLIGTLVTLHPSAAWGVALGGCAANKIARSWRSESRHQHGTMPATKWPMAVHDGANPGLAAPVVTVGADASGPILVLADDDDDLRDLLAARARAAGYRTFEVSTGTALVDGVRALLAQGEHIAAVLSDINMPECDGIGATEQLLRLNASLRVVLMSAFISSAEVQKAIKAGAVQVLRKPFASSVALSAVA